MESVPTTTLYAQIGYLLDSPALGGTGGHLLNSLLLLLGELGMMQRQERTDCLPPASQRADFFPYIVTLKHPHGSGCLPFDTQGN